MFQDCLKASFPIPPQLFYSQDDISRILPHARYSTKHGPARVMNATIKATHAAFIEQNPGVKVGLTLFQSLRPKNCRLMGSVPLESCLCIYCTNVQLKVNTINRQFGHSDQVSSEKDILNFLTCFHEERWPKITCIDGLCPVCCDRMWPFNVFCRDIYGMQEVKWQRWERNEEGKTEPKQKEGPLRREDSVVRESLVLLLDDTTHDHHVVQEFTQRALAELRKSIEAKEKNQFLANLKVAYDTCAQYLQEKLPVKNNVLKALSSLDPPAHGHTVTQTEGDGASHIIFPINHH
ncbi:hypothetical protein RRG08_047064 [Elysia crispata]|uniref:Uncharacterized protein n=1 Tax=Elysia crispata TaxID=231223 RepID=A0AAE1AV13_9GAST|nr:hypothetical protein RRG08_047064 [Elysia crispata]